MNLPGASIACEVSSLATAGGFVPLVLGDSMRMGIPDLDAEHAQLVTMANVIISPENESVPVQLLVQIRAFFSQFEQHLHHEATALAKLGVSDLTDMQEQHENAIEGFRMFIATCEVVDAKFPWTPRSLRQIFQCFLAHALEADLKAISRWRAETAGSA
jgi:hemerythrin